MMNRASSFQTSSPVVIPLDTNPDLLKLHASFSEHYPFFLNSAAQGEQGRYDILFACPGESLILDSDGLYSSSGNISSTNQGFLNALDEWFGLETKAVTETELPFTGGWFVYLSYEIANEIENVLNLPASSSSLPIAQATRFQSAIIFDHKIQQTFIVFENKACQQNLQPQIMDDLASVNKYDFQPVHSQFKEEDESVHRVSFDRIHDYIIEGDVFQVNLSRLWQGKLNIDVSNSCLFNSLRKNNPAPFAAIAEFTNGAIISSSPERLVSVSHGRVDTRPIAGTRPRGSHADEDRLLTDELKSNLKERAEHIMLLDLERNDLGRVCEPGSVKVNELMTVETYQHVHHIVSNVTGLLKKDKTPVDVIKAVFPGGTITGCPKIRCMEILAELEQTGRGAYTGSLGYINLNGDMDLNILIRSIVHEGDNIHFRAGGGIVIDSIQQHELQETRSKAKGLIKAISGD